MMFPPFLSKMEQNLIENMTSKWKKEKLTNHILAGASGQKKRHLGKDLDLYFFLALGHKFRLGPILYFEIEFFYFISHLISISSPLSFCLFFSIYWSGIRTYNLRYITYGKYLSLPIGDMWCMADFTLNTKAS